MDGRGVDRTIDYDVTYKGTQSHGPGSHRCGRATRQPDAGTGLGSTAVPIPIHLSTAPFNPTTLLACDSEHGAPRRSATAHPDRREISVSTMTG